MRCVNNQCEQGRKPCPAPFECGAYPVDEIDEHAYDQPDSQYSAFKAISLILGLLLVFFVLMFISTFLLYAFKP